MMTVNEKLDVVQQHVSEGLPVDTVPLAKKLGLSVYRANGWPDHISGKIVKDDDHGGESGYAIYVNGSHSEGRRRFTIAHEIAHYVLHQDLIGDGIYDNALYRSNMNRGIEIQANQLAAEILMPQDAVIAAIGDSKIPDINSLAKAFNVSDTAMSIRVGHVS